MKKYLSKQMRQADLLSASGAELYKISRGRCDVRSGVVYGGGGEITVKRERHVCYDMVLTKSDH